MQFFENVNYKEELNKKKNVYLKGKVEYLSKDTELEYSCVLEYLHKKAIEEDRIPFKLLAKDPKKQNIAERYQKYVIKENLRELSDLIESERTCVCSFMGYQIFLRFLPTRGKKAKFLDEFGNITSNRPEESKSIDLLVDVYDLKNVYNSSGDVEPSLRVVIQLKRTDYLGGHQDNVWSEMRKFLKNGGKNNRGCYFCICWDGDYKESKDFSDLCNEKCFICESGEVVSKVVKLLENDKIS